MALSIKLIVTDMDGTLLDADHTTVPPRNIAAFRAARARGVKLAIASGRTWCLIQDTVEQLGGIDYAILGNGAAVRVVESGEHIYENAIPNAQAQRLIRCLKAEGLPYEIYCRGQNLVERADQERIQKGLLSPEFAALYRRRSQFEPDLIEALAGRPMEKINLFYVPPERREAIQAAVRATGPVEITNALASNMEINYGGASKGTALAALAERLGLSAGEVMAFGDADNDLEMLSWAGWSFAMENAVPEAKAAAKYVTAANTEAGVAQAVEKFVLGEE